MTGERALFPLRGRFLNGRNFPEARRSCPTAFGIAHRPCLWPVVGGKANGRKQHLLASADTRPEG